MALLLSAMVGFSHAPKWPPASGRQLSFWRKLQTKKGRKENGLVLIEGVRLIGDAMSSGRAVTNLLIGDDAGGHHAFEQLHSRYPDMTVQSVTLPRREFDKLTDTVHASGIAAIVAWTPRQFDPEASEGKRYKKVLVCDRVADPGNAGTLIRTAAGLGVDAVFLSPGSVEASNPKLIRAAAGALFHLPIFEGVSPAVIGKWCLDRKLAVFVADAHRGKPMTAGNAPSSWALVVGAETIPLDPYWSQIKANWVCLPLKRGIESLNAAVAGAIIMDRLCRDTIVPAHGSAVQRRRNLPRRNA